MTPEPEEIQERTVSAVAGRAGLTKTHAAMLVAGAAALAMGFVFLRGSMQHPKAQAKDDQLRVRQTAQYVPAALPATPVIFKPPQPQMTPAPPPVVAPPPQPAAMPQQQPDPMAKARHASLLAYGSAGNQAGPQPGGNSGERGDGAISAERQTEFGQRLVPTRVSAVSATVLKHGPYLLHKGDHIICVLQSAVDTTLPGSFTCRVPVNILGETGITLIDRASIVYGETGGTMLQGQNRAFALAAEVRTPRGVVAAINSPVTDSLGRTGMDVTVQTHAGQRILNSVLLGIASGGLQAAASMSGVGGGVVGGGATQSAISDALSGSVNIRPTGVMNQGDIIGVTLAREVDFSTVYGVSVR